MNVLHLDSCPIREGRGRPTSASRRLAPTVLAFACLLLLWSAFNTASAASGPVLNGALFLKITTTNAGLQTLSASALANALGQSPADISAAIAQGAFSLTNHGQPVHWLPSAAADALLFYGEAHRDNYSYQNVYWLTQSTNHPSTALNGQAPTANTNIFYPAVLAQEIDAIPASSLPVNPDDDFWMWTKLVALGSFFNSASFSFNLDHVAAGPGSTAQLTLQLWGFDDVGHRVRVDFNSAHLATNDWSGITANNLVLNFSPSVLLAGANRLTLYALTNTAAPPSVPSQWYLNSFSLTFPRYYFATQGLLEFEANSNAVLTVDGFTSPAITVLDLDNPKCPAVVTNLTVEPSSTGYRVSFVPASPSSHCLAYQTGAGTPVNSLALAQVLGLSSPTNAADYLIIAPTNLLAAATNLAVYRQQTGLRSSVVPLDPIYNEFGFGFPGPHAIQGFLATAYTNWTVPPRYVVLFGDGTYDYRNLQSYNDNLVPPLMVSTSYGLFCSDSLYGDVNGDGLPELAVGRLSGHSPSDMLLLVNKIILYEAQPLPSPAKAILIADTPGSAGDFNADIATLDATLAGKFSDNLIRATDIPDPVLMQSVITNAWNQGVELLTYAGHGAIDRFGSAGYVTVAEVANLQNTLRWPVVLATTCVAGQFSVPGNDCIGEYLVRKNAGGAIAMLAPTGLSWDNEASLLNDRLVQLLHANTLPALGDSVRQAMTDHVRLDNPNMPVWIYNLLGDPALRFNVVRDLWMAKTVQANGNLLINWSGGKPPYQVEMTTDLQTGTHWAPVGSPTTATNLLVPVNPPAAFFRVKSSL
jgi:hypothetical protein